MCVINKTGKDLRCVAAFESVNIQIDFLFCLIDSFSGQIGDFQLDDALSGVLHVSECLRN